MKPSSELRLLKALLAGIYALAGCAVEVRSVVEDGDVRGPIVVGRAVTLITGETSRRYEPKVRFFEVENQNSNQRFSVEIDAQDAHFAVALPPGTYRLNRVQISEGPFMSMADLAASFSVGTEPVTHVGTWRFGVDSPRYGRMLVVSMVLDKEESNNVSLFLDERYPALDKQAMTDVLPQPSHMEARLFEVMPYPRYPRYFRRHLW